MIFRWPTFSKAPETHPALYTRPACLLFLVLFLARAAGPFAVSGLFSLADSIDPAVRKKKDYSGIVVWLEPGSGKAPSAVARTFTVTQKNKRFTPHVLVVPVGSLVDFPNLDPIFHNAFSNFAGQPFDTGLYPPGTSQRVRFTREGVVRVFCNIHSSMSAVIIVVNTPWYAMTRADGAFRIEGVPPGDYRMHVWHERASEEMLDRLQRRVTVAGEDLVLEARTISESGYLEVPHKNKFGQEYAPEPSDGAKYSGSRK